jgi:hypothetical protein
MSTSVPRMLLALGQGLEPSRGNRLLVELFD